MEEEGRRRETRENVSVRLNVSYACMIKGRDMPGTYHGGEEGGTSQQGGGGSELHGWWLEKRGGCCVLCVLQCVMGKEDECVCLCEMVPRQEVGQRGGLIRRLD